MSVWRLSRLLDLRMPNEGPTSCAVPLPLPLWLLLVTVVLVVWQLASVLGESPFTINVDSGGACDLE